MADDISEDLKEEIKERFDYLDTDHNGLLTKDEVTTLLREIGSNPTDEDITELFNEMDTDKNGQIDIHEFQAHYIKTFAKVSDEEELSEAFKQFDKNNDGFIDAEELRTTMIHFGKKLTAKEAQEMVDLADINGDGKVNYSEFVALMSS